RHAAASSHSLRRETAPRETCSAGNRRRWAVRLRLRVGRRAGRGRPPSPFVPAAHRAAREPVPELRPRPGCCPCPTPTGAKWPPDPFLPGRGPRRAIDDRPATWATNPVPRVRPGRGRRRFHTATEPPCPPP